MISVGDDEETESVDREIFKEKTETKFGLQRDFVTRLARA